MIINYRVKLTLLLYLLVVIVLVYTQPKIFYKKNGDLKPFGVGEHKTIFPMWLAIMVSVVLCYYLANLLILIRA